jgi:hypothetical protein
MLGRAIGSQVHGVPTGFYFGGCYEHPSGTESKYYYAHILRSNSSWGILRPTQNRYLTAVNKG